MDAMEAIQKAHRRIAALQSEIDILEDFVRSASAALVLLNDVPGSVVKLPQPDSLSVDGSGRSMIQIDRDVPLPPQRKRITDNPKPAVLIPAVIQILRERAHPLSRRQIHEALLERGLEVKGADPTKTLGTILWRARDRVDSIEGRGYWPKGDALPEVSRDELLR